MMRDEDGATVALRPVYLVFVCRGVAAHLIEERHRHALAPPVGEAVAALHAQVERYALLVDGVLALGRHHVQQFVDDQRIAVDGQAFAVALGDIGLRKAVAGKLHTEAEGLLIARPLGGAGLAHDDRVRILADERGDFSRLERLGFQILRPQLDSQRIVDRKRGGSHGLGPILH